MPDVVTLDDMLVEAIQNGDQSALGRVIEKYAAYVGTIVWNIVQVRRRSSRMCSSSCGEARIRSIRGS